MSNAITNRLQEEFFGAVQPVAVGNAGATPVPNAAAAAVQSFILNANTTIGAPINPGVLGQLLTLVLIQDTTGGRTLAWNAAYKNAPATTASAANSRILTTFRYDGVNWQYQGPSSVAFA